MEQIRTSAQTTGVNASTQVASGPRGTGVAVVFDWAFAAQMIVMPIVRLVLASLGIIKQPSMQASTFIGPLLIIVIFATLGEGLRRGRNWARIVQLVVSTLGSLAGIGITVLAVSSLGRGNYLLLVPALILLIVSPTIVWYLTRPVTVNWFRTVSSADANKLHSGPWLWFILAWSITSGTLVALAASLMMR